MKNFKVQLLAYKGASAYAQAESLAHTAQVLTLKYNRYPILGTRASTCKNKFCITETYTKANNTHEL